MYERKGDKREENRRKHVVNNIIMLILDQKEKQILLSAIPAFIKNIHMHIFGRQILACKSSSLARDFTLKTQENVPENQGM